MRICVYGAGAIGAFLGAKLAAAGNDVTLIARGPHLRAMKDNGLSLIQNGAARTFRLHCTANPRAAGPQDYVILTLKAHSVAPVVDDIATLLDPGTTLVTAQNGIPWWYFHTLPGPFRNVHLDSIDSDRRIWNKLRPERAIGSVVYASCEKVSPGVVNHLGGNRFMLGEPNGAESERIATLAAALSDAGLDAPIRRDIREDIWFKLLGNATFNPVSVLTQATLDAIGTDQGVRDVIRSMMNEVRQVAAKLDVSLSIDLDERIDRAVAVGPHRTSMLQDFEAGRSLEIDALAGAVAEIGRLAGVPTPTIDIALALVRLKADATSSAPASK